MSYDDTTKELPEAELKSEVLTPATCGRKCPSCAQVCELRHDHLPEHPKDNSPFCSVGLWWIDRRIS